MTEHTAITSVAFTSLEIAAPIAAGLNEMGYHHCTPIQAATLPIALQGRDVAGQAQTGTGKTAAFLVATIQRLLTQPSHPERKANQPRALILAPTRELAIQIHKDAEIIAKHAGLSLGLIYGGTGYESQRTQLTNGVDIIIGTPGRIIDYFKQHVFDLRAIDVFVIDEADRMFDLGFIKDVRFLLRRMPPPDKRLGLLFSATMSLRVTELAYEHMNNPEFIRTESERMTAKRVRESIYYTANNEKIPLLLGLMQRDQPERSIIFVNTKRAGEKIQAYLTGNDIKAVLLTGDVPQKQRQRLLEEFADGQHTALVATDIAARGLHIPDVSHVFNYDLPSDPEDYVHRIGRTGRFGASGEAVSFGDEENIFHLPDIETYIGHKIDTLPIVEALLLKPKPPTHQAAPRVRPHNGAAKPGSRRRRPPSSSSNKS